MIFRIDLLRGRGIPAKSGPMGLVIVSVAFVVPMIAAIAMLGSYMDSRIITSIQRREIGNYERKLQGISSAVELFKSFEREKGVITKCLSEVSSSIGRHTQWSPVLVTVVKNMPDSVVLTGLEIKQNFITRQIDGADEDEDVTYVTIPVRKLQMSVRADSHRDDGKAVRDFQERLRVSSLLGPKLEDIRVSRKADTFDGQDIVSYEIDCIFKPEL